MVWLRQMSVTSHHTIQRAGARVKRVLRWRYVGNVAAALWAVWQAYTFTRICTAPEWVHAAGIHSNARTTQSAAARSRVGAAYAVRRGGVCTVR